jgi:hypothetical protein
MIARLPGGTSSAHALHFGSIRVSFFFGPIRPPLRCFFGFFLPRTGGSTARWKSEPVLLYALPPPKPLPLKTYRLVCLLG